MPTIAIEMSRRPLIAVYSLLFVVMINSRQEAIRKTSFGFQFVNTLYAREAWAEAALGCDSRNVRLLAHI